MHNCSIFKLTVISFILGLAISDSYAQVVLDELPARKGVDVTEKPGQFIPLDVMFTNDKGDTIPLGNYFNKGKPVILVLAYYNCPMLCTLVLNGLSDAVRPLDWLPGKEFQIVTISIDPRETVELASAKKYRYIESLGKPGVDDGWIFCVGGETQSRRLADALGFGYYYDKQSDQYAHPAVVFILTEEGKISRYLYGIEFNERDVRFSLLDASKGKIGNTMDRIILFCYHYDPDAKGYVLFATNIMRLGGVFTVFLVAAFIIWQVRQQKAKKLHQAS